jgi:two-component system, LytTR family, response regulator
MKRAIIIDDELAGIKTLQTFITRYAPNVKVIGSTCSPETGIELIEDYRPDIVFLDISMPTMTGFELLDKLQFKQFKLIFTTAHEEFALKALKMKAFDYLLKPIDIEDFKQCMEAIAKEEELISSDTVHRQNKPSMLELQVKDGIIYLKQHDIISVHASGNYTEFHLEHGVKHLVSKSLKEYEQQLDQTMFFRCHHSHIVNLLKVERFLSQDGFFARMSDGSMVDISRKNKDVFLERLKSI